MDKLIAFFPRNLQHAKFFGSASIALSKDYGINSAFIRELGEIKDCTVFQFEKKLEKMWNEIDTSNHVLENLRKEFPDFNFMRSLYSEREFNFFPFYYRDEPVTYEHQLKYLVGCFEVFGRWLDSVNVEYIVSELVTGIADAILKAVAEKKGIKYYSVRQSKLNAGIVVCDKHYDEPIGMESNYRLFKEKGIPESIRKKAQQHIDSIRGKILQPSYMELTRKPFRLFTAYKINTFFKRITIDRIPKNSISAKRHPLLNPVRWSFYKLYNVMLTNWNHKKWFSHVIGKDEQYFVYPLHYEPESSTLVRAFYFSDQLALIKLIAKVLPLGVKLVVKEHGGNRGYRKPEFYRELSYLPNVILLPPEYDVSLLVSKCLGVITLTGRMGWEAIVNNKQVITLGKSYWSSFPTVHRAESWRDLYGAIEKCCDESYENKPDDNDVLLYTAAYLQCVHAANFVLNTLEFVSEENIKLFCDVLLELSRATHDISPS